MSSDDTKKKIGRPRGTLSDHNARQLDEAANQLVTIERDLLEAREHLTQAIRAAHQAGASTRAIADHLGLSHQRVHQLLQR